MHPLAPTYTADLLLPLHSEWMGVLRGLEPEDWERPTVAGAWRVRDVAAHLLDVQLRTLSVFRDGHLVRPDHSIEGYDDLVRFLDKLNAEWVAASRRLSPRVLIELLATVGPGAAAALAALPPHEPALFGVAWADEEVSENWMHVGREYTEWWHHQAQIRDAVGAPALFDARWFVPLFEMSLRVLGAAYRTVESDPGACLLIAVDGPGGGAWSLERRAQGWRVCRGHPAAPRASVRLDPDTAWKTLYHALDPVEARSRARTEGDERLLEPFFRARSVMVSKVRRA